MREDGFNWLGNSQATPKQHSGDYRRVLSVRATNTQTLGTMARGDPMTALAGLRLLSDDKSYIRGFLYALQLPDDLAYALLMEYRHRWEQTEQRTTNPNMKTNRGRRAANIWLQQGAQGFANWSKVD